MKKKRFNIMAILLIIIFCVAISPVRMQNDTYYTIAIGQHIMEKGIEMQDPFSWHKDLPYTYPHWGYDVIIYLIYALGQTVGGIVGAYTAIYVSTCIISVILGISIYKVNKNIAKNEVISFLVTIGTMYILKDFIAARAQSVTFILFILEIYFIEKFLETKKRRHAIGLILIPIVIANIHVAVWYFYFILYLPYIAEYVVSLILKCQKGESKEKHKVIITRNENTKMLILIMLICILTGFLNPLGTTTYTYLVKTMQGTTTQHINEHLPMTLMQHIPILVELIILFGFIIFTKGKLKLKEIFILGGLMALMFYSRRQLTMFALMGGIVLNKFMTRTFKSYHKSSIEELEKDMSSKLAISIVSILIIVWSLSLMVDKSGQEYVDKTVYPVQMSDWILENINIEEMRIYNEYNYGSYLLYRGIPVFIDSRADLYAPEFNTKTGKKEDGRDIFTDFIESSSLDIWYEIIFEKYDITHIILNKNSRLNLVIKNTNNDKYEVLHEDTNFILYERIKLDEAI
ncbi:MAG: hypothetical protein HFJ48_02210 [Clostridia bacterium]|nr:hypothetical protein [Clostridia bacterium]